MAIGAGFMEFAQGWNQTATGWYDEAAGATKAAFGVGGGSDSTMVDGATQNAEGHEEAERGENMMGGGISEMLGLVDHGNGK